MLTRRTLICGWLIAVAALSTTSTTHSVGAEERLRLALVCAKTSSISELSLAQVQRLYLGDPVDAAGKKLIALNRALSTEERASFDKIVLHMTPEEVSRYWVDRKIRGQPGSPKVVEPGDIYQRVTAKLDGSVGYVRLNELHDDVKVLRIDGKLPTDKGYLGF
jgi:hypothetical protein